MNSKIEFNISFIEQWTSKDYRAFHFFRIDLLSWQKGYAGTLLGLRFEIYLMGLGLLFLLDWKK